MNRRRFLSTTMLSPLGLMALTTQAQAFTEQKCDETNDLACRELVRHRDLLAQINAMLAKKGLTEDQQRAVLAAAMCPFCGQPLLG